MKYKNVECICTVVRGSSPRPKDDKRYYGGNIPRLMVEDVTRDGMYVYPKVDYLTEEGAKYSRPMKAGDLTMVVSGSPGVPSILAVDACIHDGFAGFRNIDSSKIIVEYLYFWFLFQLVETDMQATGAIFRNLTTSQIKSFQIAIPSLAEQRRIAAQLKARLAEVDKARQAAEVQLRDAQFLQARMLETIFTEVDSAPRKKIGAGAETKSGSTPPRGQKVFWEPAEIPWIKTAEVAFAPVTHSEENISKQALADCSLRLLPKNTVLIAMYGQGKTRGQSAILKIEAATNQACFAILPNETWEPEFLYLWLKRSYQDLRSLSEDRGGNQANLNGALLKAVEVPAPSKPVQKKIIHKVNAVLNEIESIISASKESLSDLGILPQKILAQAFEN